MRSQNIDNPFNPANPTFSNVKPLPFLRAILLGKIKQRWTFTQARLTRGGKRHIWNDVKIVRPFPSIQDYLNYMVEFNVSLVYDKMHQHFNIMHIAYLWNVNKTDSSKTKHIKWLNIKSYIDWRIILVWLCNYLFNVESC